MNRQNKTIEEWVKDLPLDIHEKFMVAIKKENKPDRLSITCTSFQQAIASSFAWCDTVEGYTYWSKVRYNNYPKQQTINNNYEIF